MISGIKQQMMRWPFLVAGAAAALAVGCGGGSSNHSSPGGGVPAFQITAPVASATVNSATLNVAVQATNFQFTPASGTNVAGRGHVNYWLDADPTSDPALAGAQQSSVATWQVPAMTAGAHTLYVELRNNDGTPLSPRVLHSVAFTYTPGAPATPAFQITAPTAGGSISGATVPVTVTVTNFTVGPAGANQAGQGHLNYWLDVDPSGDPATAGAQQSFANSFQLTSVAAGAHTLYIELRQNDGAPLSPRVLHSVAFTTTAAPPAATVQFTRDILPIFTNNGSKTCAQAGCHAGGSPSAGQNLEAANAYASIVNVNSSENASLKRVKPGDAANSYLFQKINSGAMPLIGGPLTQADKDKISTWINEGALNN